MMSRRRRSWLASSAAPCCFAVAAALLSATPCAGQTSAKVPMSAAKGAVAGRAAPVYRLAGSVKGMQGIVVLDLSVDKDGKVKSGYFLTGAPLFAWAAIVAARKWRLRRLPDGVSALRGTIAEITFDARSPKAPSEQMPLTVPAAVAKQHLVRGTAAVYPKVEKGRRIQGVVALEVSIGKDGRIKNGHFLTGPPQLAWAAVHAISKWRFRPFLVDGTPRKVNTVVEITFAPRSSKARFKKELRDRMVYSQAIAQCFSLLSYQQYVEAGKACNRLPRLAEALPAASYAERVDANHYAGLAAFDLGDYGGSVAAFRQEVSAAKRYLKVSSKLNIATRNADVGAPGVPHMLEQQRVLVEEPADFELGRAYGELAAALSDEGKFKEAVPVYKRAISVFEHQRRAGAPGEGKNGYVKLLGPLFRQYADVLRKTGRTRDAAKAMRKADKLAGQIQK